jgi:hypothetical protein
MGSAIINHRVTPQVAQIALGALVDAPFLHLGTKLIGRGA